MLKALPRPNQWIWGSPSKSARGSLFYRQRKQIAHKLANPNILKIGLHSFRHYYASMLYPKTSKIVIVKKQLGHKSIENTMKYIQIHKHLFLEDKEKINDYEGTAIQNTQDMKHLLEIGYERYMKENSFVFVRRPKKDGMHRKY